MERISSMFFCLSLLIYYILKLFKVKKSICVKTHIVLGRIYKVYWFCSYYDCNWNNWSYDEK